MQSELAIVITQINIIFIIDTTHCPKSVVMGKLGGTFYNFLHHLIPHIKDKTIGVNSKQFMPKGSTVGHQKVDYVQYAVHPMRPIILLPHLLSSVGTLKLS